MTARAYRTRVPSEKPWTTRNACVEAELNLLIAAHNRCYPIEPNLPLDPGSRVELDRGETVAGPPGRDAPRRIRRRDGRLRSLFARGKNNLQGPCPFLSRSFPIATPLSPRSRRSRLRPWPTRICAAARGGEDPRVQGGRRGDVPRPRVAGEELDHARRQARRGDPGARAARVHRGPRGRHEARADERARQPVPASRSSTGSIRTRTRCARSSSRSRRGSCPTTRSSGSTRCTSRPTRPCPG